MKRNYLVLYNAVSAATWAVILARTINSCAKNGPGATYDGVGNLVKWAQTAACLEILHSLLGRHLFPLPRPIERQTDCSRHRALPRRDDGASGPRPLRRALVLRRAVPVRGD